MGPQRFNQHHVSIGRGDKIRTCDPLHPMQVRYQAAPRPDRMRMIAEMGFKNSNAWRFPGRRRDRPRSGRALPAQNLDEFFEFQAHLVDELLALVQVHLRVIAGEAIAGAADGEALLV
jgi:hypothetical protein